jgi:hypothetical protein
MGSTHDTITLCPFTFTANTDESDLLPSCYR